MSTNSKESSPADSEEKCRKETNGLSFFTADDNETSSESEEEKDSSPTHEATTTASETFEQNKPVLLKNARECPRMPGEMC